MSYSQALEEQMGLLRFSIERGDEFMSILARQRGIDEALGPRLNNLVGHTLEHADAYYWSPEMCNMLVSVADAMPSWTLRREDLVTPSGFMHFAKPLPLPSVAGREFAPVAAIAWADIETSDGKSLIPVSVFVKYGRHTAPFVAYPYQDGELVDWTLLDDALSDAGEAEIKSTKKSLAYIGAALALCQQRIIVTPSERAERSTRKRAADVWTHEPLVRVVKLRRAATQSEYREPGSDPVEWSCSWVVRGHWRQQACGENYSERRPVFVLPHVKGPTDKPLKAPADRVFAVAR